jgi:hypothetical protein
MAIGTRKRATLDGPLGTEGSSVACPGGTPLSRVAFETAVAVRDQARAMGL